MAEAPCVTLGKAAIICSDALMAVSRLPGHWGWVAALRDSDGDDWGTLETRGFGIATCGAGHVAVSPSCPPWLSQGGSVRFWGCMGGMRWSLLAAAASQSPWAPTCKKTQRKTP